MEPTEFARQMRAILERQPQGWGLYCMEGQMLLVPPDIHALAQETSLADQPQDGRMIPCGRISGDSGGW